MKKKTMWVLAGTLVAIVTPLYANNNKEWKPHKLIQVDRGNNEFIMGMDLPDPSEEPFLMAKKLRRDLEDGYYDRAAKRMFILIAFVKYDAYRTGKIGHIWDKGGIYILLQEECIPEELRASDTDLDWSIPLERILPLSLKPEPSKKLLEQIYMIENDPNGLRNLLRKWGPPTYSPEYLYKLERTNIKEQTPLDSETAWGEVLGEFWRNYE
jgi:hypothetical protein